MPIAIAQPLVAADRVKLIGLTGSRVPEKISTAPLLEHSIPGISVYAGWMVSLPPDTKHDIVAWYQNEFSRAIKSSEYRDWAVNNYILIDENQLTARGVQQYAEQLRKNFRPIITQLSK
jgi:tripartite-type tricarboxylate transporter receptor subunit TctC